MKSPPTSLPYLQYGDSTKNALVKLSHLIKTAVEQPRLQSEPTPAISTPPIVTTPSIVVPPPLPPLPRVVKPVTRPPVKTSTPVLPQFQKLSLPLSPRVQKRQPFVPVSKANYHLNHQMFFNMPTPKQRLSPQPVGQPHLLQRPTLNRFQQGKNFRQYAVQHLQAEQMFTMPTCNHVYNNSGKKETIDTLLKGNMGDTWSIALSNELGRLAQGVEDRVIGADTINFIPKSQVPHNKKVTYANFVCDYRPLKSEPHRVRLTVVGDDLIYVYACRNKKF